MASDIPNGRHVSTSGDLGGDSRRSSAKKAVDTKGLEDSGSGDSSGDGDDDSTGDGEDDGNSEDDDEDGCSEVEGNTGVAADAGSVNGSNMGKEHYYI